MKITKKAVSLLLVIVLCLSSAFVIPTFAQTGNLIKNVNVATSVPQGYKGIYSVSDLDAVRNGLGGKYILMNDIDLSTAKSWTSIGTVDQPFAGIFNGNGYAVKGMTQLGTTQAKQVLGLFGVAENAIITNLKVENVSITQTDMDHSFVGGIVGVSWSSKILNCYCSGTINITATDNIYAGGIVGTAPVKYLADSEVENDSVVANCLSDVALKITGEGEPNTEMFDCTYIGGIIGEYDGKNDISRCINNGKIDVLSKNYARVGGIAGSAIGGSVLDSANNGPIFIDTTYATASAGGICGGFSKGIERCYNTAKISGAESDENSSLIISAYGIAGCLDRSGGEKIMKNCYYADTNQRAIKADNVDLTRTKALSAEKWLEKSSFRNFDFKTVWNQPNGAPPTLMNTLEEIPAGIEMRIDKSKAVSNYIVVSKIGNENIAVLESDGKVKGVAEGSTTVEIITSEGQFAVVDITVKPKSVWTKILEGIVAIFNAIFSVAK